MPVASPFMIGLVFSALTLLTWGMLPVVLKLAVDFSDPITLTWLRFLAAFAIVLIWQGIRGKLSIFRTLSAGDWIRLTGAGIFLMVNYVTFTWSMDFLHPGEAQLNFQTAPFFLAIGGLLFLSERVYKRQWLCFAGLALGMLLFFHPMITQQSQSSSSIAGIIIIQVSAAAWSLYAILQKALFKKLSPTNILLAIYALAAVILLPFAEISSLNQYHLNDAIIVAVCCINTLLAYVFFAQAMKYWQTVQVSATIALTPVANFLITELCVSLGWWPELIKSANLDLVSLTGLMIVVAFAILVQILTNNIQKQQLCQSPVKA